MTTTLAAAASLAYQIPLLFLSTSFVTACAAMEISVGGTKSATSSVGGSSGGLDSAVIWKLARILPEKSISKRKLRSASDVADVQGEIETMPALPPHPNVMRLRDVFEDWEAVYLVREVCEGGELFDHIVARGHYTERAAVAIMKTILVVVQHCHKHGVMHRDLKPENFMFANESETSPVKVNGSVKLLVAHITWHQKSSNEIMGQKLMYGVLELSLYPLMWSSTILG